MARIDGRNNSGLRRMVFTTDYIIYPEGSVLVECGNTKVICNVSIQQGVPDFLKDSGRGWLTAEYSMLPRATNTRNKRDISKLRENSRSVEIQRLIGRSLRAALDFEALGERTLIVDCDVIQADGGTRTASINGGYVALWLACERLVKSGVIKKSPVKTQISAISAGIVKGAPMVDLCYEEDSSADVDFNFVMTGEGEFIELQGTGERRSFSMDELNKLLALASCACVDIQYRQREVLSL